MAATSKREENEAAFQALLEKVSENFYNDKTIVKQEGMSSTSGYLVNQYQQKVDMYVVATHNWSGDVTKPYRNPLPAFVLNPGLSFTHEGALPTGSKGGVVYADGITPSSHKWVLAWDTPNNKVYVEAGPFEIINWDAVEVKLNASSNKCSHYDEDTGAGADAQTVLPWEEKPALVLAWFNYKLGT